MNQFSLPNNLRQYGDVTQAKLDEYIATGKITAHPSAEPAAAPQSGRDRAIAASQATEQPADRAQRDERAAALCDRFAADFTTMPPKNPFEHGVQTACVRLAEAFRGGGLISRAALARKGD